MLKFLARTEKWLASLADNGVTSMALLIVVDPLRCRFACFKLGAHLLDLRCLLLELLRELRDGCL